MMQGENHPCFTNLCSDYARVHLPIAPKCNIQCNYCLRKFDCANECRPGVASKVMRPEEAALYYKRVRNEVSKLTTIGIAGPGDALANFSLLEETLKFIREFDKDVNFCLSTNGLLLPKYADRLLELEVGYITVTVNAISLETAEKIYSKVEYDDSIYYGKEGTSILLEQQQKGIQLANRLGFKVKINTVAIKGVNTDEIPLIAQMAKRFRCDVMNIIPLIPVMGTSMSNIPILDKVNIDTLREVCGESIKQMFHCKHCRADAVGPLK